MLNPIVRSWWTFRVFSTLCCNEYPCPAVLVVLIRLRLNSKQELLGQKEGAFSVWATVAKFPSKELTFLLASSEDPSCPCLHRCLPWPGVLSWLFHTKGLYCLPRLPSSLHPSALPPDGLCCCRWLGSLRAPWRTLPLDGNSSRLENSSLKRYPLCAFPRCWKFPDGYFETMS